MSGRNSKVIRRMVAAQCKVAGIRPLRKRESDAKRSWRSASQSERFVLRRRYARD